jgi:hypothetical protein
MLAGLGSPDGSLVTDCQLVATASAAAAQHRASVHGLHTRPETVGLGALSIVRLKCAFRHVFDRPCKRGRTRTFLGSRFEYNKPQPNLHRPVLAAGGGSLGHHAGDLAEDRADRVRHAGHNRARRDGDEPSHQGILDEILSPSVFPDADPSKAGCELFHVSRIKSVAFWNNEGALPNPGFHLLIPYLGALGPPYYHVSQSTCRKAKLRLRSRG